MTKTALLLVTALLAGCADLPPNRPANEPEHRAMGAALAAWVEAGRPAPVDEHELRPDRAHIAALPARQVQQECLACWPGPECRDVVSCIYMPNRTAFEAPSVLIIVSEELDGERYISAVVHEYLHAVRARVVYELLRRTDPLPAWAVQGENGAAGDLPDRPHNDTELWEDIEPAAVRLWGSSR